MLPNGFSRFGKVVTRQPTLHPLIRHHQVLLGLLFASSLLLQLLPLPFLFRLSHTLLLSVYLVLILSVVSGERELREKIQRKWVCFKTIPAVNCSYFVQQDHQ